jgi:hypothetical protein
MRLTSLILLLPTKNPIHKEITNFWKRFLRRLMSLEVG